MIHHMKHCMKRVWVAVFFASSLMGLGCEYDGRGRRLTSSIYDYYDYADRHAQMEVHLIFRGKNGKIVDEVIAIYRVPYLTVSDDFDRQDPLGEDFFDRTGMSPKVNLISNGRVSFDFSSSPNSALESWGWRLMLGVGQSKSVGGFAWVLDASAYGHASDIFMSMPMYLDNDADRLRVDFNYSHVNSDYSPAQVYPMIDQPITLMLEGETEVRRYTIDVNLSDKIEEDFETSKR